MFVNTRAAYKLAEQYGKERKGPKSKGKGASSSSTPNKTTTKQLKHDRDTSVDATCSSDISTTKSTSTWAVDHNAKLRRDAMAAIEAIIADEGIIEMGVTERIKQVLVVAEARLRGGNQKGAILSMKKVSVCKIEQQRVRKILEDLDKLFLDVAGEDTKPQGYKKKASEILAQTIEAEKKTEAELLEELSVLIASAPSF